MMLTSLFRPARGTVNPTHSSHSSSHADEPRSPFGLNYGNRENRENRESWEHADGDGQSGDKSDDDDDGYGEDESPLLPIFSSPHLGTKDKDIQLPASQICSFHLLRAMLDHLHTTDSIPVYHLTHAIRSLVIARCETTLSWDQLRSPQISQFLVKPIQNEIMATHFSNATLYTLMANCLQFHREVSSNPENSGISTARALVCELLAIKLLREYDTRQLIDALSYDFDPMQGLRASGTGNSAMLATGGSAQGTRFYLRIARIPCLEVAIKAQAKRFLAHPLVVKQLEAIWAGVIVIHSTADNLHRFPVLRNSQAPSANSRKRYGTIRHSSTDDLIPQARFRRSVTIYNPKDASLFKLSRLRVPRYRHLLSTFSFAILLGLFLAVLAQKSQDITSLEVVFWFWSAGFMLDEVVGFNEQGFSLYILSFWNLFDLGILLLFICYYCLRIYGVVTRNGGAALAYDILAATAILLFPRLFSVLDHYRYFSQLLIAFRIMAIDLIRILVLICVACSGFFVAFTLSFGDGIDGAQVAYALFQILMGFTPAAWEQWPSYNLLGKGIMAMFLVVCHFLVVTILITVLTNSVMAIVQNANEEHQFLFAINTISMVKSDSLFSYIAPSNILGWILTPLRFILPFHRFVRVNRTVIKITHSPILFGIYLYEKLILRPSAYELTDLIGNCGKRPFKVGRSGHQGLGLSSPQVNRLREPSITTYQKDRVLEEVFSRPLGRNGFDQDTHASQEQRNNSVVNKWMQAMGPGGPGSPPMEQDQDTGERPKRRRYFSKGSPFQRRAFTHIAGTEATMSIVSAPDEFSNQTISWRRRYTPYEKPHAKPKPKPRAEDRPEEYDDGDDEMATNEGDESEKQTTSIKTFPSPDADRPSHEVVKESNIDNKDTVESRDNSPSVLLASTPISRHHHHHEHRHQRNFSTTTVLYNPVSDDVSSSSPSPPYLTAKSSAKVSQPTTPTSSRRLSVQHDGVLRRPKLRSRAEYLSAPNIPAVMDRHHRSREPKWRRERPQTSILELVSDIGDNKAVIGGIGGGIGTLPSSLQTGFRYGGERVAGLHEREEEFLRNTTDEQMRMAKLMLARMNALEESFRTVLDEVRNINVDAVLGKVRARGARSENSKEN